MIPFKEIENTILKDLSLAYQSCIRHNLINKNLINGFCVDGNGTKIWLKNCKYHRLDGPALEYLNGDKYWYLNGIRHREDGPAIEYNKTRHWAGIDQASRRWFIHGISYSEIEYNEIMKC